MKDLDGYKVTVTRDENSVIYDSDIDYNKLDVDKLKKIEGNEKDHFNSSNKLTLKEWYNVNKTYGTTCKGV